MGFVGFVIQVAGLLALQPDLHYMPFLLWVPSRSEAFSTTEYCQKQYFQTWKDAAFKTQN